MRKAKTKKLVFPGLGYNGIPLVAVWWRYVVGSAMSVGVCRWRVRSSRHAFSGAVVVAAFSDRAAAVEFAGAWGFYCGCNIAMRQHVTGGQSLWAVSVPVFWPRAGQGVAPSRANDRITWVARH